MIKKSFYLSIGVTSLALGILGVFIPLLPTTCFLIFAAWAFSKSSKQLHDMLYSHKTFGPILQNWHENKSIPRNAKTFAVGSIFFSGAISYYLLQNQIVLQLIVVITLIIVASYLIRLPTAHQILVK